MTNANPVITPSLQTLAQQCAQETQRFFQHQTGDARSCLELFQRAIVTKQEKAWEAIYQQYEPQVTKWVLRHPSFSATGESADYFVNLAFLRLWTAITPAKFAEFSDIREVMRYLQLCVHSVIIDYLRARPSVAIGFEDHEAQRILAEKGIRIDAKVLNKVQQEELWEIIKTRLQNEKERFVFDCCYKLDMKPGEIFQQYRDRFKDVREIYRIKENILARLRRDKEIQTFLQKNAGKHRP